MKLTELYRLLTYILYITTLNLADFFGHCEKHLLLLAITTTAFVSTEYYVPYNAK